MNVELPTDWHALLADEIAAPGFHHLAAFVDAERRAAVVYPPEDEAFAAFRLTPFHETKVVLIGQDPYHGPGQAHGLCFSVKPGIKPPPSLANIFKELRDDLGCRIPTHGCLTSWAEQGVLLLNAVLTVRAGEANSHKDRGWERFTDAVIRSMGERPEPAVFVLWGNHAQKKAKWVDAARHRVVIGAHPSPLSVARFRGSKPFSAVNEALRELGREPIDWALPDQ